MISRRETITVKGATASTPAKQVTTRVHRTVHGPVVGRGTVGKRPIAVSNESSYWKKELAFVASATKIASRSMSSVQEFEEAVSTAPLSFNALYADASDIGYFRVGAYPRRAQGVDRRLPSWGTGKWEWKGTMPWAQNPKVINPAQGWIANWNNKPAAGWDSSDHSAWGPTQRVHLLTQALDERLNSPPKDKLELTDVINVARVAATQDSNAVALHGRVRAHVSPAGATETTALAVFDAWVAGGAHRQDKDRDQKQDSGPAVALWDGWYDRLIRGVFDDEVGGLYDLVRIPISDGPARNNGSSYFYDYSNFIWNLLGTETRSVYQSDFCDDSTRSGRQTCEQLVQEAFKAAVTALVAEQGTDVAKWSAPAEYLRFNSIGSVSVPSIPWQNRGTWNHAVEVTGAR
jgi:acyl-homoserine lactone acylase PvdQ